MRIHYRSSGGFAAIPGLQKPVEIDVDQLDEAQRALWQRRVAEACFFEMPEAVGVVPQGAADLQADVVTIIDGERSHTVRIKAPLEKGPLQELLAAIRLQVNALRASALAARAAPPSTAVK